MEEEEMRREARSGEAEEAPTWKWGGGGGRREGCRRRVVRGRLYGGELSERIGSE